MCVCGMGRAGLGEECASEKKRLFFNVLNIIAKYLA